MKTGIIIFLGIILTLCAGEKIVTQTNTGTLKFLIKSDPEIEVLLDETAHDETSIMMNSALTNYREKYVQAKQHKAFAQSVNGAWATRTDRTSSKNAALAALLGCEKANQKWRPMEQYPCKIIHIDDQWGAELSLTNKPKETNQKTKTAF